MPSPNAPVLIAGAGIAGLTAALCLARQGFSVTVFERSPEFQAIGAGIQLSPNATRILQQLNILPRLEGKAASPGHVALISGKTLKPLLTLDLANAGQRWGAPYLVTHRADLHAALCAEAASRPAITIETGSSVVDFLAKDDGVQAAVATADGGHIVQGALLIGADGVWSSLREKIGAGPAAFSGYVAYRNTISSSNQLPGILRSLVDETKVAAFLAPDAHLVAYPLKAFSGKVGTGFPSGNAPEQASKAFPGKVGTGFPSGNAKKQIAKDSQPFKESINERSGGESLNLVAIARGAAGEASWQRSETNVSLPSAFGLLHAELAEFLMPMRQWSSWPIHAVPQGMKWSDGARAILIGDAAHAMAPFAAQGAAMAIEDAWALASCVAANREDPVAALALYEKQRRPRIAAIARRTDANRFAYHAGGMTALARDTLFRVRGQKMLEGLDWIYGFGAEGR